MCRQFIAEFCEPSMPVFMYNKDGDYKVMTVEQLLPMGFSMDALQSNQHQASEKSTTLLMP
ncbi:MAG: hypothetical protein M1822_000014 [Bathelium mastoideum]|nr:MAG: hypothetical protein M1822_000014 [Bathelium mastoideum]